MTNFYDPYHMLLRLFNRRGYTTGCSNKSPSTKLVARGLQQRRGHLDN